MQRGNVWREKRCSSVIIPVLFLSVVVGGGVAKADGWDALGAADALERCKAELAQAKDEIAGLRGSRGSSNPEASGERQGGRGADGGRRSSGGRADDRQWNPVVEYAKLAHGTIKKALDDIMDTPDAKVDVNALKAQFGAAMEALEKIGAATAGGGNENWSEEFE